VVISRDGIVGRVFEEGVAAGDKMEVVFPSFGG
jgi:hypothetical protein